MIKKSLTQLVAALAGLVAMNAEINHLFLNILDNAIPDLWMKISYGSLKPLGSYVMDLVKRLEFFDKWIKDDAPSTYWISGFYFT